MKAYWLLALLLVVSCVGVKSQDFNGECYETVNETRIPRRCEPLRRSFSLEQRANSTSTCGTIPTPFCVRSVISLSVESDCSGDNICDASNPDTAHPAAHLTDYPLSRTWWQSENSMNVSTSVTINIPLLALTEITVISFDFKTIKPAAFYIEKSTDSGKTYQPYHFFAVSCEAQYGLSPDAELDVANETSALCQTISEPPDPGVISFFPAVNRPSANDSDPGYSEALYGFITATNIRVILDVHYELDLADADPGYYYALEDINVVGSCQCYGHASSCVGSYSNDYECECRHNTAGRYCDRCLDFYQDIPWQRAISVPFECKRK